MIENSFNHTPPKSWMTALRSENGGMSRPFGINQNKVIIDINHKDPDIGGQLLEAVGLIDQTETTLIAPPKLKPGQYQSLKAPTEFNPVIKTPLKPPKPMLASLLLTGGLLAIGIGVGVAFRFKKGWPLLLSGPGVLLTIDGAMGLAGAALPAIGNLAVLSDQSIAMLERDFQPFETVTTDSGKWLISNGGPSRFEEMSLPKIKEPRDCLYLKPSVHGSNHLSEEAASCGS